MSLSFKFIPLTFLSDENEIKKQIRNTIILKYFFERNSETVHLEDLINGTQYGYNASALVHGRNKFLRISDITDGKVNWETVPYCNCADEETYLLFPNDILIARTGGTTGKSFLISEPPALSIYAGYLIRIRANEDTNPNYLNLFLNSYVYWSQIVSLNEDNFRPSVNANKLKKLILPKCDKTIQDDAVKISNGELIKGYDELYLLIEETLLKYDKLSEIQIENKKRYELQKKLKQAILQEAIEGKLTSNWRLNNNSIKSSKELIKKIKTEKEKLISAKIITRGKKQASNDLGNIKPSIPVNWEFTDLDDITQFITDGTHQTPSYTTKGRIFLSAQNVKPFLFMPKVHKYISEKDYIEYTKNKIPERGDILIGRVGSKGEAAVINENIEFAFYVSLGLVKTFKNFTSPDYITIVINSPYGNNYATGNMSSIGTSAGNYNLGRIRSFPIPFPPLEEQIEIVNRVNNMMTHINSVEQECFMFEKKLNLLLEVILKEAFEIKNTTQSLDSLFEDVNYNLYVAMIHKQIENRLKINYGEVATQKTVFNINAFTDQKIPYNFINSNHGTFSPQLKDDLSKNSYLAKDRKGNGEVFIINPSKQKEVLNALSNPKNKSFVRAVNEVLDIYELPFINKETDKIELLNTVAKLIIDSKSRDLETIYTGMQKWEIKQNGFKTKAEKFSKTDTKKMIGLIEDLGLASKLLQ